MSILRRTERAMIRAMCDVSVNCKANYYSIHRRKTEELMDILDIMDSLDKMAKASSMRCDVIF